MSCIILILAVFLPNCDKDCVLDFSSFVFIALYLVLECLISRHGVLVGACVCG